MEISVSKSVNRIFEGFRRKTFDRRLVRPAVWISVTLCAAYACSSGTTYAQETTPSATVAVDDKETKEVQPLVEPAAQAKPWFNLYGWIEAGITGNPNAPADNHNFGY